MPTGGLLTLVRIAGAVLILVGWVAWGGYRFAEAGPADDASLFPFFIAAQWLAPEGFRRSRVFWGLLVAAAMAWGALFWRFGTAEYHQTVLIMSGAFFALCVLAWVCDRGYRRWKTIESPTTRVFLGTAVVTAIAVPMGGAALYLFVRLVGSAPKLEGNWMITALILYLPVMGLIALGFHLRRKLKNDK